MYKHRLTRTVFAVGVLTSEQVLVRVVAAVVVAVTELAPPHTDVGRQALVLADGTRRHRTVQLVGEVAVSTVVSLVAHLTP